MISPGVAFSSIPTRHDLPIVVCTILQIISPVIPLIKTTNDKNKLLLECFIVYTFQNHLLMLKMKNKELKYGLLKEGEKYLLWKYKNDILQSYNDVLLHLFINDFINHYHLKLNDIKNEQY